MITVATKADAAANYAKLGWPIVPLWWVEEGICQCHKGADCSQPAKHPIPRHGLKDASTNEEDIRQWWHEHPQANIGTPMGHYADVLDLDSAEGYAALEALESMNSPLPDTLRCLTSKGEHKYFRHRPGLRNWSRPLPGMDIRTTGGYAILPPSVHATGKVYEWGDEEDIEPWPDWLFQAIIDGHNRGKPTSSGPKPGANGQAHVAEGGRNAYLTSRAGAMRARGFSADEIAAALQVTNTRRCRPPLSSAEVESIARSVANYDPKEEDPAVQAAETTGAPLIVGTHYTKENPPPRRLWTLEPWIAYRALAFVHAPPKSSKSNLVFYLLCEALRQRSPIPGVFDLGEHPPRRVLILTEMPEDLAHAFMDLYDPDYALRGAGLLVIASDEFKTCLSSAASMGAILSAVVERDGFDVVVVDTFLAFATITAGASLSEGFDTEPMLRALRAIPAAVAVVHHDRKAADGETSHVHMLGTTAIRAASDANLGIVVLDEETTLMRAELESRDPEYLRYLARCAEALARGESKPPPPDIAQRSWYLRLGYDQDEERVIYREAESDLIPVSASNAGPKHERGDVIQVVNDALAELHHGEARKTDPVHVFTKEVVHTKAASLWARVDGRPFSVLGRPAVEAVLGDLPGAVHVRQGAYPDHKRRAGYGMTLYLPKPLGNGATPTEDHP